MDLSSSRSSFQSRWLRNRPSYWKWTCKPARRRIDASGPKNAADRQLDALLDQATGGASFSTSELEKIEKALRRYLTVDRPRAVPRLLLFLYPGRISRNGLKELREVKVEVDLLVDPCSRSICRDSVGKNLELLGKAIKQPVLRTESYSIRFMAVIIRTNTEMHDSEMSMYRFSVEDVIDAGRSAGGGNKLITKVLQVQEAYGRQVTKDVAAKLRLRRVKLLQPPRINREAKAVQAELDISTDRIRYQRDVLNAFLGTAEALRSNELTPVQSALKVIAHIPLRTASQRIFECMGQPLGLLLDGRLSQDQVWSTYVIEKKEEGTKLTFDDEESSGGRNTKRNTAGSSDDDMSDAADRIREILSAHISLLAPCLTAEASRNRLLKGVTLTFAINFDGRPVQFNLKGSNTSGALKTCLQAGLNKIRFPKHSGEPQQVEFPMLINR